jgi:hypothetical protein
MTPFSNENRIKIWFFSVKRRFQYIIFSLVINQILIGKMFKILVSNNPYKVKMSLNHRMTNKYHKSSYNGHERALSR